MIPNKYIMQCLPYQIAFQMLLLLSYSRQNEFFLASPALEAHLLCMYKLQMWLERYYRQMISYLSTKEMMQNCLSA